MPKLSPISANKLVKILEKLGFEIVHQKGSHIRLRHSDSRVTTIPMHSGENIGVGLLGKILKDVNLSRDEFLKLK